MPQGNKLENLSQNKVQKTWHLWQVPVNLYHLSCYLLLLKFLQGIYANPEKRVPFAKFILKLIFSDTEHILLRRDWMVLLSRLKGLSWERKSNEETVWELKNQTIKQTNGCKCKGHYNNALISWVNVADFLEAKLKSVENQCSTLQWMLGQALPSQIWHPKYRKQFSQWKDRN